MLFYFQDNFDIERKKPYKLLKISAHFGLSVRRVVYRIVTKTFLVFYTAIRYKMTHLYRLQSTSYQLHIT